MRLTNKIAIIVLLAIFMSAQEQTYPASQVNTIAAIGKDIAALKAEYPQLTEFSVSKDVQSKELVIRYDYHTHQARHAGGWTAGVPNPDDDGIWFRIDFHDPASNLQIHTQPVLPPYCFEDKKLSFLILEGKKTKLVADAIWTIFLKHGVKYCPEKFP